MRFKVGFFRLSQHHEQQLVLGVVFGLVFTSLVGFLVVVTQILHRRTREAEVLSAETTDAVAYTVTTQTTTSGLKASVYITTGGQPFDAAVALITWDPTKLAFRTAQGQLTGQFAHNATSTLGTRTLAHFTTQGDAPMQVVANQPVLFATLEFDSLATGGNVTISTSPQGQQIHYVSQPSPTVAPSPLSTTTPVPTFSPTPTPSATPSPTALASQYKTIKREAEGGFLNQYVEAQPDAKAGLNQFARFLPKGATSYPFVVANSSNADANYWLWLRVKVSNRASDSIYVVYNQLNYAVHFPVPLDSTWRWVKAEFIHSTGNRKTLTFALGNHTLKLVTREDSARIDAWVLTNNPSYQP